ncbi:hypothetical protein HYFRA_00008283 [Hymenoscyphus fraxineus]|uniref:Uncharacterized protein n=1 Tax=Hymenoscyphus fraxineus TaxID=746836 RepID=A0A9N9KMZ9_9HELO|nr:hypothetical protein HYFRA_00008283 [Hymenoscyphus fraxineus]
MSITGPFQFFSPPLQTNSSTVLGHVEGGAESARCHSGLDEEAPYRYLEPSRVVLTLVLAQLTCRHVRHLGRITNNQPSKLQKTPSRTGLLHLLLTADPDPTQLLPAGQTKGRGVDPIDCRFCDQITICTPFNNMLGVWELPGNFSQN